MLRPVSEAKEPGEPCPVCGVPRTRIISCPSEPRPFDREFPYYDKGAGRIFQNRQERSEWAKSTDAKIKKRWGDHFDLVEANG